MSLNQPVHRIAIVGTGVEELAREENAVLTGLLKLRSEANA
ncbi:MAG TPA: hypothetical protein VGL34_22725 [Steroidobacteraceae bacterium]|jgi:hypothetical protein